MTAARRTLHAFIFLSTLCVNRQSSAQTVPFPYTVFRERDSVALWLLRYDACGWRASDALLERDSASIPRLGPEWLCFRQGGQWHAVFGRFDSTADRYEIVVHYLLRDTVPINTREPLDTPMVTGAARALHYATAHLPQGFTASGFRFNTYVVPNDSILVVWMLPAWQPTGEVVFGGEAEYAFDPSGRRLKQERVLDGPLRWFRPDSTVAFRIDSDSPDVPTVGNLFFFYLVRRYFKSVRIKTAQYSSIRVASDSGEVWVHVLLDRDPN